MVLATKTLFEKSVIFDRITFFILVFTELINGILFIASGEERISMVLLMLSLLFIFVRGERTGLLRRLRSLIDVFLIFCISGYYFCDIAVMLIWPKEVIAVDKLGADLNFQNIIIVIWCVIFLGYLYYKLYRKKIIMQLSTRERVVLYCFSGMIMVVDVILQDTLYNGTFFNIPPGIHFLMILCVLVSYIEVPLLVIKNHQSVYYKIGKEHQQELLELQLEHFEKYKESQEETKKFRHDIINHLLTVQMLQKESKNKEAEEYIDNLLGIVQVLSPKIVTGCDLLDGILEVKLVKIKELSIEFKMEGVLDRGLSWSPEDICIVFANAIDNAIEACESVVEEKRFIRFSCKKSANFYYIQIVNSADSAMKYGKNVRFTTKKNKELHGYGLENIKDTVKKYGGEIKTEKCGDSFSLQIMIPV
ncbi:Sensor histidine kinase YesM [Lachnospiraceae bacterium KH1T2]|nr:Sensor histidine kinase YesM [Lachnospiraceae bacterium KH1T2]